MAAVIRFAAVLGLAAVILLPHSLRAEDDPSKAPEGLSVHSQDSPITPLCEIDPIQIGVVKTCEAFQTSGTLLYLQPGGNLQYGTVINPYPLANPHWSDLAVDPVLHPAFNVGLRYVLDGGGDVRLDWTRMNSYDHGSAESGLPYVLNSTSGPAATQALGPPFLIGPPLPFAFADAVAHFAYDAVNLDAGMSLGTGGHVQVRLFAGLQGARVGETLSTRFLSLVDATAFDDESRSLFTGVGPRLGMELHYVAGNLDLLGGIAGATLIGSRQSRIDFVTTSPGNAAGGLSPNYQFLTSPTSTQVIPCIDTRLGASYAIAVGRSSLFRCEVGYQATVYLNAINQFSLSEVEDTLTAQTEGIDSVFMRTSVEIQSNFLVHGPYLKFSIEF